MSVSHSAQCEPTRVDVWTVLEELPHRVQDLLRRHESSREHGFEVFEQEPVSCRKFPLESSFSPIFAWFPVPRAV